MIFNLFPRKKDAAPDPLARPPMPTEGGFGRLRQACADALASIAASRPASGSDEVQRREGNHVPVALAAAAPANMRVEALMAARTGRDPRATARPIGQAPASIVMPARSGAAGLAPFMPRRLDD